MEKEPNVCGKGHERNILCFCSHCKMWVCRECREKHIEHEGLLKDLEELTNVNIMVYAEDLKLLKAYSKQLSKAPSELDYEEVKQEIIGKINTAYDQLFLLVTRHKEQHLKQISDYIDRAKRKRQRLETQSKLLESNILKVKKILFKLNKFNIHKIPKRYLLKYNDPERIKEQEKEIELVKATSARCATISEKLTRLKRIEVKTQMKDSYISKMIKIPNNFNEERRLILIQPNSPNMIIANIDTMRKRQVPVLNPSFHFPEFFEFIQAKHKIILTGGTTEEEKYSSAVYEISPDSGGVKSLASMNIGKKYHSLCALSSSQMCVVGGLGPGGPLRAFEMYSLISNNWIMQAPLNEAREGPACCTIGGKYIYCFGGRVNADTIFSSIEMIDISYGKLGWTLIPLPSETLQPTYFGLAQSLDNNRILISGGLTHGEIPLARSYLLNLESYELQEVEAMKQADCFLERDRQIIDNKLYAISYQSYAIHIFDTVSLSWNIIKSSPSPVEEEKQ